MSCFRKERNLTQSKRQIPRGTADSHHGSIGSRQKYPAGRAKRLQDQRRGRYGQHKRETQEFEGVQENVLLHHTRRPSATVAHGQGEHAHRS